MGLFGIKDENIDLSGLEDLCTVEVDMDEIRREGEQEKASYKAKYGDDWYKHWVASICIDYDADMKCANEGIYFGEVPFVMGTGDHVKLSRKRISDRMHALYGDRYEELRHHEPGASWAVELLLNDALKTGKWKELPDCLQDEYHKRIGDIGAEEN